MRRLVLINVIVILFILGAASGLYYYFWQQTNFIVTDDAQISGQLVTITPPAPGNLTNWAVKTGDQVSQGQVVGTVQGPGNLVSPIAGTIVQSASVVPGQIVVPGQPLAQVTDLTKLSVVANIQETDLQDTKVGNTVDITVDAYPGTRYTGTVASIGVTTAAMQSLMPAGNPSGTYTKTVQRVPVTITFTGDTSSNNLKPGMNASVRIHR